MSETVFTEIGDAEWWTNADDDDNYPGRSRITTRSRVEGELARRVCRRSGRSGVVVLVEKEEHEYFSEITEENWFDFSVEVDGEEVWASRGGLHFEAISEHPAGGSGLAELLRWLDQSPTPR